MDSHQLFRYSLPGTDISYETTPASTLAGSEWMLEPVKFGFGRSPDSPLSTHFDVDTFSTLSNSQEQNSSTENFSWISSARNSPLEFDNLFQNSPANLQDRRQVHSVGRTLQQNAVWSMEHALQELESDLMGPYADEPTTPSSSFRENQSTSWGPGHHQEKLVARPQPYIASKQQKMGQMVQQDQHQRVDDAQLTDKPRCYLKQLLIECARAISENNVCHFEKLLKEARSAVSISGEPIQRLGAYMLEGLVARQEASGTNIYRALKCHQPEGKELLSYMHILYDICPYLKFGYMAANGAIAEAFRDEDYVHIVDFQIAQGTQWVTLIQALAARPGGPPHVRITGIDDPVSKYARGDGLQAVGERLAALSKEFNIPLEFHSVPVYMQDVTREMIDVRPGEAVAVNFTLQLHHMPDESVDINNPRDKMLRMVKSLSPKVTTLVEQESNTNTTPFLYRFIEALDFYCAVFESIDVTLPRESKERISVEQHCLARDIVNVIACEGKERVERHELLGKWKSRLSMAGFRPYQLSSHVNSVIRTVLKSYSQNYTLVESDGAMLLGWKDRNLISASAWH
ncbi:chitin-inducible gibberellin-responsive protein 1-like [Magnolia sinica]|uniref:chitin-inducible gibberellin-responsive protein 1-like n=1 Tax=Magnolia sinica TaxID=86752 RepID=UPI002658994D|nr:chitin-inducible gibberellin-responsive protein 1-like [Magnolia sinica]